MSSSFFFFFFWGLCLCVRISFGSPSSPSFFLIYGLSLFLHSPSLPASFPPSLLAAVDPNSGTAAQLEVAKGLGALLQTGWKPRRTIVLASWSGEELGLIGSTAWGEQHARELDAKAVLYVNVDSAVSGPFFQAGATPSLRTLLEKLQEDVRHPYDGEPIARNWTADGGIGILGSGSDYTVFLDHLGE
jgi:N-acetylated-alpha-linked acidic dipeptidase